MPRLFTKAAMPAVLLVLTAAQCVCATEVEDADMIIAVNGTTFAAILEDSPAAKAFANLLPLTLKMEDLHGNEKYHNMETPLPSRPEAVGHVRAGDIMLFGDNCVVIFYKSFATAYTYTRIGRVDDAAGLEGACGEGRVTVMFSRP